MQIGAIRAYTGMARTSFGQSAQVQQQQKAQLSMSAPGTQFPELLAYERARVDLYNKCDVAEATGADIDENGRVYGATTLIFRHDGTDRLRGYKQIDTKTGEVKKRVFLSNHKNPQITKIILDPGGENEITVIPTAKSKPKYVCFS